MVFQICFDVYESATQKFIKEVNTQIQPKLKEMVVHGPSNIGQSSRV